MTTGMTGTAQTHAGIDLDLSIAIERSTRPDGSVRHRTTIGDGRGLQCGFCTPGMILVAKALLESNPDPTEDEIRHGIAGNLCRCTGYHFIVKSIQDAAGRLRGDGAAPGPGRDP
jgi:carbon-monoxide dehydrogenase small subunit